MTHNDTDRILDDIDALVDEQLAQESSGYDHNINQPDCCHCGGEFHGLPLTWELLHMRFVVGAVAHGYRYADDDSPVACPGSFAIAAGPIMPSRLVLIAWNAGMHDRARGLYAILFATETARILIAEERRREVERARRERAADVDRVNDAVQRFAVGQRLTDTEAAAIINAFAAAADQAREPFARVAAAARSARAALRRVCLWPDMVDVDGPRVGYRDPATMRPADHDFGGVLPPGRTLVGRPAAAGAWVTIGTVGPEGFVCDPIVDHDHTRRLMDAGPAGLAARDVIQRAVMAQREAVHAVFDTSSWSLDPLPPVPVLPFALRAENLPRPLRPVEIRWPVGDPLPAYVAALDAAEFVYRHTALHAGGDE